MSAAAASSMFGLARSLCIWFTSMKRNSWFGDSVSDAVRYPVLFWDRFWLAVSSTACEKASKRERSKGDANQKKKINRAIYMYVKQTSGGLRKKRERQRWKGREREVK